MGRVKVPALYGRVRVEDTMVPRWKLILFWICVAIGVAHVAVATAMYLREPHDSDPSPPGGWNAFRLDSEEIRLK